MPCIIYTTFGGQIHATDKTAPVVLAAARQDQWVAVKAVPPGSAAGAAVVIVTVASDYIAAVAAA